VELAGAIAELATTSLKNDFRNIDTAEAQVGSCVPTMQVVLRYQQIKQRS